MITQLRQHVSTGSIHDLAHVVTQDMLADCLTKSSAKPDNLIYAVNNGVLKNVDKNPGFREMMRTRHKAYVASWLSSHVCHGEQVLTFLGYSLT